MGKLISSESVYWCQSNDRYIRVFKLGDAISGINFMQGDDYELFNDNYAGIDEDLTNFYKAVEHCRPSFLCSLAKQQMLAPL